MTPIAALRASELDLPLIVHVFGAMALVGLLAAAALALLRAWRVEDAGTAVALTRFGLWALVAGAVPAWIVMRIGAEWIYSRGGWEGAPDQPGWLDVGYLTADLGGILLVAAVVLAVVGLRRLRGAAEPPALARAAGPIAVLLVAAYVVAIWAMTAKPD